MIGGIDCPEPGPNRDLTSDQYVLEDV